MKTWIVEKLGPAKLGLTCPHADCGGKAVVTRVKWTEGRMNAAHLTRPCTYCFRAAKVPLDLRSRKTLRQRRVAGTRT